MTMTDPVADYLTRLRNAIQAGHKRVDVPASNTETGAHPGAARP